MKFAPHHLLDLQVILELRGPQLLHSSICTHRLANFRVHNLCYHTRSLLDLRTVQHISSGFLLVLVPRTLSKGIELEGRPSFGLARLCVNLYCLGKTVRFEMIQLI